MDEYRQKESLSFDKNKRRRKKSHYTSWSIENPVLIICFVILMAVGLVVWMGSHLGMESSIIQKSAIGSIALHDYKAPRDFVDERIDTKTTESIRAQRVAEVLPIYSWNNIFYEQETAKLNAAFDSIRENFVKYRDNEVQKRIPKTTADGETIAENNQIALLDAMFGPFEGEAVFDEFLSTRPLNGSELAASLTAWSTENRSSFETKLGVTLDDDAYTWLVSKSFSRELQDEIIRAINTVLTQKIVNSRSVLENTDNITVQWIESGHTRTTIYTESDKTLIAELSDSKALMRSLIKERFADAPLSFTTFMLSYVKENFAYNESATEHERENVRDKTIAVSYKEEYKKGQTIISSGNQITEEHYLLFQKMMSGLKEYDNRFSHWAGIAIIIALMGVLVCIPIMRTGAISRRKKNRDLIFLFTCIGIYAIGIKSASIVFNTLDSVYHFPYSLFLVFPFAGGGMLVRIVITKQYAFYYAVMTAILTSLLTEDLNIVLPYAIVSALASSLLIERPKRSSAILRAGIWLGILAAATGEALYLLRGGTLLTANYITIALLGLSSGLLSCGVVMIGLPLAESLFGYATSNKLLELSNLEHPALKTLFMEAPGTYQHSIMVGTLNEAAADAIGANAILARVGGYYHDIGKTKNAQYFAENQHGDNPHNRLKPNMSALILKAHERDGLEIASKYHLPKDILDFIISHHGTGKMGFFYDRAIKMQADVREEDYRYPGPKPQTRETGICMVSDMVEAAVRSMKPEQRTPDGIKVLVRKLINAKFADGQFDECDLTLRDLNDIAGAVCGIMNAFYHHRPEYPEQKKERERLEAEKRAKEAAEADKTATANNLEPVDSSHTDVESTQSEITSDALEPVSAPHQSMTKLDAIHAKEETQTKGEPSNTEYLKKNAETTTPPATAQTETKKNERSTEHPSHAQTETVASNSEKQSKTKKTTKSENKSDELAKELKIVQILEDSIDQPNVEPTDDKANEDQQALSNADLFEPENSQLLETEIVIASDSNQLPSPDEAISASEKGDEEAEANALLKDDPEAASRADAENTQAEEDRRALMSSETYEISLSSHVDVFRKS